MFDYHFMCGIIGLVNASFDETQMLSALNCIKHRGVGLTKLMKPSKKIIFGQLMCHIFSSLPKSLDSKKSILVTNCSIYNWKKLAKENGINAEGDAGLIQKLIDKKFGFNKNFCKNNSKTYSVLRLGREFEKILNCFDGDYSLAYYSKCLGKVFLARDLIGVKPIVYHYNEKNGFSFASEKKALTKLGLDSTHLNPREIAIYDINSKKLDFFQRKFFYENDYGSKRGNKQPEDLLDSAFIVKGLLEKSVRKRLPQRKLALFFSSGIDSLVLAKIIKE